jgi:hypothetical protein
MKRYIGKARSQIDNSARLIREQHPAFVHIPHDRSIVGVITTAKAFYLADAPFSGFDSVGEVPVVTAPLRDIEFLVGASEIEAAALIAGNATSDGNGRRFIAALPEEVLKRENPILSEAWTHYAFLDPTIGADDHSHRSVARSHHGLPRRGHTAESNRGALYQVRLRSTPPEDTSLLRRDPHPDRPHSRKAVIDIAWPGGSGPFFDVVEFVGTPAIALLLAVLCAMVILGTLSVSPRQILNRWVGGSLGPIAGVVFIVGAAGGFSTVIVDSGSAQSVLDLASGAGIPILLLAFGMAALLVAAIGSSTVAGLTAASLVAPSAAGLDPIHVVLLTLAAGAGSSFLVHVNSGGFWLSKEYFGLTAGAEPQSLDVDANGVVGRRDPRDQRPMAHFL